MSGLRSSNCDGTPIGTAGGAALSAFTGIENDEGSLPVSTAIACSYCARATPRLVSADCAFCKVFSASTTEISVPTPGLVLRPRAVQRLLVVRHRLVVDRRQRVLPANLEEVLRQARLLAQPHVLQVRRAHLRVVLLRRGSGCAPCPHRSGSHEASTGSVGQVALLLCCRRRARRCPHSPMPATARTTAPCPPWDTAATAPPPSASAPP